MIFPEGRRDLSVFPTGHARRWLALPDMCRAILVVWERTRHDRPRDPRHSPPSSSLGAGSLGTTRAGLGFRAPPSRGAVEAIARISVAQGWGLSMVGELLAEAGRRAEARGAERVEAEDVGLSAHVPRHGADAEGFEAALLEVLRAASGPFAVGELRRRLTARCVESGVRAPTPARVWRHLVRLERMGIVQREVRMGGAGGTSVRVSLFTGAPTSHPWGPGAPVGRARQGIYVC